MLTPDQVTAVVLAGGFGTRVQHLLPNLPKPMAPVAGRPFLEWVVRWLAAQKIRRVILSTGHRAEVIEAHFRSQPVAGVTVTCVPETKPLGTGGGFLNAIRGAAKPSAWLVLNGDSLALAPLAEMFAATGTAGVGGAMLTVRMADASRYGTVSCDAGHVLTGFNEKKPGAGAINAGVYLFAADAVTRFPSKTPLSFETQVFPALINGGVRIKVCETDAPFLDIGTQESLAQAETFIRQKRKFFES